MKSAIKSLRQYPPHLGHCYCTTLGNKKVIFFCRYSADIKKLKQILIFLVFKIWSFFSIPIANKIFHVIFLSFFLLLWSICGIRKSSQQMSLQWLSTNNMVFSDEDKILIKRLYLKGYTAKRLTDEFPEKSWTKHGVNKLLKKLWNTGTVDIATKRNHTTTGSFQSYPHFTEENNYAFECLIL